jgi:HD-GYP domain-containing protein (c-di-GMP phosphodiesterase class II)
MQINDSLKFSLYVEINNSYKLLLEAGNIITREVYREIVLYKIYIKKSDRYLYKTYIDNVNLNENWKKKEIYFKSVHAVENILKNPEDKNILHNSKNIVVNLLDNILADNKSMNSLLEIMSHDYYTHTHSLNVSIYAISFGKALGFSKDDLTKLGISGLLHDLGKSKIEPEIINKPGRLTDDEFTKIKLHPRIGHRLAKNIGITDPEILGGILDHHEKFTGLGGYPNQKNALEITSFGRIIAIADIFDALSTERSYKKALTSFEAMHLMKNQMHDNIDPELMKTFISLFTSK